MATTTKHQIPYPADVDDVDVPADIQAAAEVVDAKMSVWTEGALADRPAASKSGRWYRRTDGAAVYVDDGDEWLSVILEGDARLANQRTPTDASVTNAKIVDDAGIALSKLAAGTLVYLTSGISTNQTPVNDNSQVTYISLGAATMPFDGTMIAIADQHGVDTRGGAGSAFGYTQIGGTGASVPIDITGGKDCSFHLIQGLALNEGDAASCHFGVSIGNSPVRWQPRGVARLIVIAVKG
jgi:hypothetical protein